MAKQLETSEQAKKDYLKTRYYKTNILLIMEYVKDYFTSQKDIKIISYDTNYNEISVQHPLYNMTIRFIQVQAQEAAVDVFIDSYFLFDFSKTKNTINNFYEVLNQKFELVGLALHKEG